MIQIQKFSFNPFQENTYLLYDLLSKECLIIDPGCSNAKEDESLISFIEEQELTPTQLINTHCHIDHVLGNQIVADKYNLKLMAHRLELPVLASCTQVSQMYGIPYRGSPKIEGYLEEGESIRLGDWSIDVILAPGHSPGSICLYLSDLDILVAGDVLFQGSIGRTDLPGGDYDTLIGSIMTKLLRLPDQTIVYPGHGPKTTIGEERTTNPFLL